MNKLISAVGILMVAGAASAIAEPTCDVPKAEWQAEKVLTDKLTAAKWTVKKVKVDNGCYEVYGTDDKGKKVEIYYNPKTLEPMPGQED